MADFERAIGAVQARLSSDADELPLWQAKTMQQWCTTFVNRTKSHHDFEEQVSRGRPPMCGSACVAQSWGLLIPELILLNR